jgi:phenol 2-monooxygenase
MPSSAVTQSEVDVLIVGAGPAGLMACNALVRSGINVRIVDQRRVHLDNRLDLKNVHSHLLQQTNRLVKVAAGQADGIQPRTLEVLQVSLDSMYNRMAFRYIMAC